MVNVVCTIWGVGGTAVFSCVACICPAAGCADGVCPVAGGVVTDGAVGACAAATAPATGGVVVPGAAGTLTFDWETAGEP